MLPDGVLRISAPDRTHHPAVYLRRDAEQTTLCQLARGTGAENRTPRRHKHAFVLISPSAANGLRKRTAFSTTPYVIRGHIFLRLMDESYLGHLGDGDYDFLMSQMDWAATDGVDG